MTPSATPAEAPPGGVTARTALILLLLVTLLRLAVAARMPLSPDEAYYWVWSKALAPGYLDHPPMVALWIWLGTHLAGDSALGVRVLGPISAFAGSLLLVQAGRDLAPGGQAGERAAWMLNATLVLNAGAVIMTPDTPLLFFWSAALAAAARLQRSANPAWFLAIGVAAGLGLDSKYTAMLLAPVLLVWLLLAPSRRAWLRCWQLYAGAVLAAVLFAPVVLWNAAHGFASFAKQGGRGAAFTPSHAPRFLAELLSGQIGLATPVLFVVFSVAIWHCVRRWRAPGAALAGSFVLVPAAVFAAHALGDRVQANWPAVLYPGAALAAGLARPRWQRLGVVTGAAISAIVLLQAAAAPLPLPRKLDFTLIRQGGWQDLARDAAALARASGAGAIAADEYGLAAELAVYQPLPVIAVEPRWSLFDLPAARAGGALLLLRSTRRAGAPDATLWPGLTPAGVLTRARHGVVAETYDAFIAPAFTLPPDAVRLPH